MSFEDDIVYEARPGTLLEHVSVRARHYQHLHLLCVCYIYIYIYIYILRATPSAAGPFSNQLTGDWKDWQDWQDLQDKQDWQGAGWGQFWFPRWSFGRPGMSFLVPWGMILVIQGSLGTPSRTPWGPDLVFS